MMLIYVILGLLSLTEGLCTSDPSAAAEELDFLRGLSGELDSLKTKLTGSIKGFEKQKQNQCEAVLSLVTDKVVQPRHCKDVQQLGYNTSGVYTIFYQEGNIKAPLKVYCDMETNGGGWTVIQRRRDGHEDFYRGWDEYSRGFGELENEFWLGNYHIYRLTTEMNYQLRVDLESFENETRHASYNNFQVASPKDKFELSISGYAGDAANSFTGNEHKFSTKDHDYDIYGPSCAVNFKGAWWYTKCHSSNLNGQYLRGAHDSYADGVNWQGWKGYHYSLKFTEIKIRPKD